MAIATPPWFVRRLCPLRLCAPHRADAGPRMRPGHRLWAIVARGATPRDPIASVEPCAEGVRPQRKPRPEARNTVRAESVFQPIFRPKGAEGAACTRRRGSGQRRCGLAVGSSYPCRSPPPLFRLTEITVHYLLSRFFCQRQFAQVDKLAIRLSPRLVIARRKTTPASLMLRVARCLLPVARCTLRVTHCAHHIPSLHRRTSSVSFCAGRLRRAASGSELGKTTGRTMLDLRRSRGLTAPEAIVRGATFRDRSFCP